MKNLAIFSSGSGTNAENLIEYFNKTTEYKVVILLCNNEGAFVLNRCRRLGVPSLVFSKADLMRMPVRNDNMAGKAQKEELSIMGILEDNNIYAVILAGFLMKIPDEFIKQYPGRIINIHPALLPKYGGKGMHGMNVHKAVVAAGEHETGITIHLVDEQYDHGKIIFQARCDVLPSDSPEDVAAKIHILEQANFPEVVHKYLNTIEID